MRVERNMGVLPRGPAAWPLFRWGGPALHALLRIGAALLFMQHGAQKLLGWFGGMPPNGGTAELNSLMGLAGILELVGGGLILLGLLTRPVAFLLAGQMVVAYWMAHLPQGGFPIQNQGELALLYALVFGFIFANGPGPLSLDHWLGQRRTPSRPAELRPTGTTAVPEPRRRDTAA